ncbi:MAG: SDR family NAD(P)-dependent oxidoreductase [Schleiferiaceae bacterium]|jgi:3-oxoacyl-[acyl-carrier protein] reductase|tara:strand:+ start:22338 stop:23021 length:684 start_codon:yes stop_codon:yes gene_type:complete
MEHTILIVGHRTGIGRSIAELMLNSGHKVLGISREACDYNHENLTSLTFNIAEIDDSVIPENLSGFIYCPGTINLKPFRSLKVQDFQNDFEINALGAASALQKVERSIKSGKGSVILFSTVAVGQGMPFHASVAMAKGAVEGLGKSLAAEWAPNVRVNVIAPSLTDTPMASKLLGNESRREASEQRHPLKSVGEPIDIAQMAKVLLESKWISGEIIGVNGGIGHIRN